MKIRKREKVAPISLSPGDILSVTYKEYDQNGREIRKEEFVQHTLDKPLVVDDVLIAELEKPELKALGMKAALAAVMGESIKEK